MSRGDSTTPRFLLPSSHVAFMMQGAEVLRAPPYLGAEVLRAPQHPGAESHSGQGGCRYRRLEAMDHLP